MGNNRIAGYYQPEPVVARGHVPRDSKCQLCGDDYGIGAFRYYDGSRTLKLCRWCNLSLIKAEHRQQLATQPVAQPIVEPQQEEQDDGRGVFAFIGLAGVVFAFVIVFLIVR